MRARCSGSTASRARRAPPSCRESWRTSSSGTRARTWTPAASPGTWPWAASRRSPSCARTWSGGWAWRSSTGGSTRTRWRSRSWSRTASAAAGVDVRMPFGDHRLIEYVFSVPEELRLFDDGQPKSVLRAAVADLLPAEILCRPSSQHPVPRGDAYDDVIAEEFRALAGERSAPIMEIADPARLAWLSRDLDRATSRIYVRRIRSDMLALNRFLEKIGR